MYALDVIVLARGAPEGLLTYRTSRAFAAGAIVLVRLRRTQVHAVVISCTDVRERKAEIKRASFVLSSAEPQEAGVLPAALIQIAREAATYHGTPLGQVLYTLLQYVEPLALGPLTKGAGFQVLEKESLTTERLNAYRAQAVQDAAQGKTTLLLVPTLPEVAHVARALKDLSPLVLSSAVARKERTAREARASTHPGLIIATPSYVGLPIQNLSSIILERPSSGSYQGIVRPHLDARVVARITAEERGLTLIYGDYPLPLEYRALPSHALDAAPEIGVLDVRTPKSEEQTEPASFAAVAPSQQERIGSCIAAGSRVLVLAARKGYAPTIVCRDCGTLLTDESGRTLSLARGTKGNELRTSTGDATKAITRRTCDTCGGWNLFPLGIGVERVAEELERAFPDANVVLVQASEERTPAKMRRALARADTPGSILVGTEFMLPWLVPEERFAFGLIASMDTLLAVPFWRARERFVRIAYLMRERCQELALQTRRPDDAAVRQLIAPAENAFFSEETALRKAVGFPPFGTLLTLSVSGTPSAVERMCASLVAQFGTYGAHALPSRPGKKGLVRGVVAFSLTEWPDATLSAQTAALPPQVEVAIDPESF